MKRIILLTIVFFLFNLAYSQNNCKESLYEANKLFESGNIRECINLLEPCAKQKSAHQRKNLEELIESYHLLALAHQNNNDLQAAQKYIKKMLLLKPDYQKFPNIDPVDFSRLVNQYQVAPKFYLGFKVGFNVNSLALKKSYAAYSSSQSYNPSNGYQFGINADYRLKKVLSINADLLLSRIGINHIIDNAGGWKQEYNEEQNYSTLNLGVQHYFRADKKLSFHAGIGMGFSYLTGANVFFEATNLETQSVQQATQDPLKQRKRLQTSANGMLGVSTPLAKGSLGLEVSYSYFFGNTVDPDKRMDDLNFIFNNQYVNDDISLRVIAVNLVYKHPLIWAVGLKK